jgi:hypothetical protein
MVADGGLAHRIAFGRRTLVDDDLTGLKHRAGNDDARRAAIQNAKGGMRVAVPENMLGFQQPVEVSPASAAVRPDTRRSPTAVKASTPVLFTL